MNNELAQILKRWSIWYRLRRGLGWSWRGLIFGMSFSLSLALVMLYRQNLLQQGYLLLIIAAILICGSAAGAVAFFWPLRRMQVARFFDFFFTLRERTSTALELQETPTQNIGAEMISLQLQDALTSARQVSPPGRFFFRVNQMQLLQTGILTACLVLVGIFGRPYFQQAENRKALQQAIAREITQLEAIRNQVEADPALNPEDRQELSQVLEKGIQELRQAGSTEGAVAALTSTEQELRQLSDPTAAQQAESLRTAGTRLSQSQGESGQANPLESFGQNLAEGDYAAAAQALQNLDLENLTSEQTGALADQLDEAAADLSASNPELAKQFSEAAQALREGNLQSARQSLNQAAQTLTTTGQSIAQANAIQEAAQQAGEGSSRLIQAGRSAQGQAGQAAQGGSEQGNQGGQGSGQGAGNQGGGSSSQPGTSPDGGGGGAGRGEGGGDSGQGPEAGDNPISRSNSPGDGGERPYEPIYAPQRLGGSGGEQVTLPGSGSPGDQVIAQGEVSPGEQNPSSVPYTQVLPAYAEAYRRAVESGQVPLALRSLVKKYFSSLEP